MLRALCFSLALAPALFASAGCETEGCLAGEEGCTVPPACPELTFECADESVELVVISDISQVPGGLDAKGALGDFLFRNARIEAVIDSLDHPSHLAPSGGFLLDLANRDRDDDGINQLLHAVGALPTDSTIYKTFRVIEGPGFVALQVEGHLVGDERQRVHTRYELRACEPGLRVRTEMVNGGDDIVVWSNADGYFYGSRSMVPFTPTPGAGYFHPTFGLSNLNDVTTTQPWVVGASHSEPASSMATVPCNMETIEGFFGNQVSSAGAKRRIVGPRDYEIYERFIGIQPGAGAAPGVNLALDLRRQIFGEAFATVSGKVVLEGGRTTSLGRNHARAAVIFSEGAAVEPGAALTPITEVLPNTDGSFQVRVPSSRSYVVDVVGFGATLTTVNVDVGAADVDLGDLTVPAAAELTIDVTVDGVPDHAQVFVMPADDETAEKTTARYFDNGAVGIGTNPPCPVVLGNPFGGSPACNRVLVNGPTTIDLPPGNYELYATAGIFASLAKAAVEVGAGDSQTVQMALTRIDEPAGTLNADFHVHGAASFDSTIPDEDRVKAFMAAGVDVIAATDHDAVWDYARAIDVLDADERLVLLTGLETTGLVLFKLNPSVYFPQVIGHWIFWPVPFDPEAPRGGAPWDELVEPGALIGRVTERGFDASTGVVQLNHPWANLEFARDLGFPRAIGIRLDQPVPRFFDGTGPSLFFRTPEGSAFSNADFHAQEVVNGSSNDQLQSMRALWFWQLDQGILRTGTANSDSHSLTDNVVGTPRNVVRTAVTREAFDVEAFNADVRAGHVLGTNGPIIDAIITKADGSANRPSFTPLSRADGDVLRVRVTAPAWVPVREVRILVNGEEAMLLIGEDDLQHPDDSFGTLNVVRLDREIPLDDLLPGGRRDSWIVIEAGDPMPRSGDLDCDFVPDTSDNNLDGVVDFRDVDRNGDNLVTDDDPGELTDNEPCDIENYGTNASVARPGFGPLVAPPAPPRDDVAFPFAVVTPGGFPYAFTNPFVFDLDEDGTFDGPGIDP